MRPGAPPGRSKAGEQARMKAIVTIDTEADNQWESYDTVITRNVDCIPRFQELCDRYGIRPTYLCTYEIVRSQQFDRILRGYQDREAAEIGAHLHTWTTPPFENDPDLRQGCPYTCELPAEAIRRKMEVLTEAIASKTGRRPSSYRAGRWGFSAEQIPVLLHLGYRVECSVTPLVSWAGIVGFETGGPDFTRASARPYFLDFDDVCRSGDSA
jgi:peptidoglycan/xylan/chitin deacetylase (PgdA/CDA1 family)